MLSEAPTIKYRNKLGICEAILNQPMTSNGSLQLQLSFLHSVKVKRENQTECPAFTFKLSKLMFYFKHSRGKLLELLDIYLRLSNW